MASDPPFVFHQPRYAQRPQPERSSPHPHRARLPVIPDLRFEHSYLRSIQPYVHVHSSDNETMREDVDTGADQAVPTEPGYETVTYKGKEKELEAETPRHQALNVALAPSEVVQIQWGNVIWITTRDQVISPLLQGALWGVAGHFLTPLAAQVGTRIRVFFSSRLPPPGEGLGVGWLRSWIKGLGLSSVAGDNKGSRNS